MSLPVVKLLEDCADFEKTVVPYIPQLYDLSGQVLQSITNVQALKILYVSTNPLISAFAISLFLSPLFLIASEVNKNYSQVDRFWSWLPTFYNAHFVLYAHLLGLPTARLDTVLLVSAIWSTRLTFNYWRKGGYSIGSEDYRWEVLREYINPPLFFLFNVAFISLAQNVLLFSVSMPTYLMLLAARKSEDQLDVGDLGFSAAMVALVAVAFVADQQQWNFQNAKQKYQKSAKAPTQYHPEDLDRGFNVVGLWSRSRHPNFAAEQSFWVTLYAWSCYVTKTYYNWAGVGMICYMCLFQASTWFTELISAKKYPEYQEYQKRVGKFYPNLTSSLPGDFSDKYDQGGGLLILRLLAPNTSPASPNMTTILRRSGNIATLSRTTITNKLCPHQSPIPSLRRSHLSRVAASRPRTYATTNPQEPKKSENERKDEAKSPRSTPIAGGKAQPGKPAPGFEQLYSHASPMSSPTPGQDGKRSSPPPFKASPAEQKELNELFALMQNGLPHKQQQLARQAFEDMKRYGVPPEVKEIVEIQKKGVLDLATVARLVRITTKFVRHVAEQQAEKIEKESSEETPEFKAKETKQKKKKQTSESSGSFNVNGQEIKLDTGTFILAAFVAYLVYRMVVPSENTKEITWQEFRTTFFDKGLVEKLTVTNRSRVRVDLHRESTARMYPESPAQHQNFHYYFSIGSVEAFERKLDDAQSEMGIPSQERIPVAYNEEISWVNTALGLAPTLLLLGSLVWLSRRATSGSSGQSGIFGIGKSRAKRFNQETDVQTKFKDVAGMDEAKQEIMEFVSFLKEPGQYQRLGAKIPRGAILSGPPGTGKTLLAKATAGESGVPFFSVSGSEFVEMFVGVGPSRVRDLFANARKNTPCIIFIDEIDAIGKSRGKGNFGGGNDERESTLNQILTEMDGFNTSEQVVVLAGTNRADVLDKALLRPGRFDRHIAIDAPTISGRKQIFLVHLGKIVTNEDMEYLTGRLAALTPGFSGADIANCVNEAALIAARTSADKVAMKHFEAAIERVIGGLEKKSLVLNPKEKRTVAYHEAGHAICGWFLQYADPLLKVSIIPRGQGALGYAQLLPQGDTYLMNVNQLMDRMAMTLGGRVSEELNFETVTSGASDDFNKVTRMATAMVTKWGMSSKIGYLYFEEEDQKLHKPFSEETARNIDHEVRRIVDEAYKQCRDLLTEKKKEVAIVAEELLSKEVLGREDMIRLLGKRPWEENKEFTKYFDRDSKDTPPPPPGETLGGPQGGDVPVPGPAM